MTGMGERSPNRKISSDLKYINLSSSPYDSTTVGDEYAENGND